jgi:hypothetical protein
MNNKRKMKEKKNNKKIKKETQKLLSLNFFPYCFLELSSTEGNPLDLEIY